MVVAVSSAWPSMESMLRRAQRGAEGEGQGARGSGGHGEDTLVLLITSGEARGMWQGRGRMASRGRCPAWPARQQNGEQVVGVAQPILETIF
jgi:hypothetical protein